MFLRTVFLLTALLSFSQIAVAADGRATNAGDGGAIDDAFAISMHDPEFVAAADAGKAHDMKMILVANGAPDDLELTAYGMFGESTNGTPIPSLYPNNEGPCVEWRWIRMQTSANGFSLMKVCVAIMTDGVMTYDAR